MRSSEDDGRGVAEESEDDGWRDFDIRDSTNNRAATRTVPSVLSRSVREWNVPPRSTVSGIPQSGWELFDRRAYRVFADGARTSHTPFTSSIWDSDRHPYRSGGFGLASDSSAFRGSVAHQGGFGLVSNSKSPSNEPPKPNTSELDADLVISCPVCMEAYSSSRYPVLVGKCGHSICIYCENGWGFGRNNPVCATCGEKVIHTFAESGFGRIRVAVKNFALIDLLNLRSQETEKFSVEMTKIEDERVEEKKKLMAEKIEKEKLLESVTNELAEYKSKEAASQDIIDCSKCEAREKMGRMKICETCIGKGEEVNWENIEEEKILPLCAFCSYCSEDHKGHVLREYLPWKIRKIVASTVSDGKSTVLSMDEVCFHEIEKGKEELKVWLEGMDSLRDVDCKSYDDAQSTASVLREESNDVCNASERTLPTLRMFTKVIRDSTARLNILKKKEEHD